MARGYFFTLKQPATDFPRLQKAQYGVVTLAVTSNTLDAGSNPARGESTGSSAVERRIKNPLMAFPPGKQQNTRRSKSHEDEHRSATSPDLHP